MVVLFGASVLARATRRSVSSTLTGGVVLFGRAFSRSVSGLVTVRRSFASVMSVSSLNSIATAVSVSVSALVSSPVVPRATSSVTRSASVAAS